MHVLPRLGWGRASGLVQDAGFREMTVTIEIGSQRFPSPEELLRRTVEGTPLVETIESGESGSP